MTSPERFVFSLTCEGNGCMPGGCGIELDCGDGFDNDGDSDVDCDDSDCDSYDRDGDGDPACSGGVMVDCNDADPAINSGKPELCWTEGDEDCDGLADELDDDCSSPPYSPCN